MGVRNSVTIDTIDKKARSTSTNIKKKFPSGNVETIQRKTTDDKEDSVSDILIIKQKTGRKPERIRTITSMIKQESDNIKIIKENNIEGTDAMLINDCIKNHFFMRALDAKTR
jgi:hypothetical protein